MKFVILTTFGSLIVEAEDIEEAVKEAYNNNTGYRDVLGVVVAEEKRTY